MLFKLSIFWLFISGNFHLLILLLGILSIFFVYFICLKVFNKLNKLTGIEYDFIKSISIIKTIKFLVIIFKDISKSSIFLIKKIFQKEDICDQIYEISFGKQTQKDITILAHYITATPGTVAIEQNDKNLIFYALYKENFKDLEEIKEGCKILKIFN